jgi:uncharacterized protein YndB with AHSA1/START domain
MIRLSDSIIIQAPPERVWAWLGELPAHYRDWHPDHVACRYERGTTFDVGAVVHIEERLHGRMHRFRLRATEIVPGRVIRYRDRLFGGAFLLEPVNGGTRFTAELEFGLRTPIIGQMLDRILRPALTRRLAALETHMREEGVNLKRLLEQSREN